MENEIGVLLDLPVPPDDAPDSSGRTIKRKMDEKDDGSSEFLRPRSSYHRPGRNESDEVNPDPIAKESVVSAHRRLLEMSLVLLRDLQVEEDRLNQDGSHASIKREEGVARSRKELESIIRELDFIQTQDFSAPGPVGWVRWRKTPSLASLPDFKMEWILAVMASILEVLPESSRAGVFLADAFQRLKRINLPHFVIPQEDPRESSRSPAQLAADRDRHRIRNAMIKAGTWKFRKIARA